MTRISSLNRYSYVESNPVSYLDPFGLDRWAHELAHTYAAYLSYWCSMASVFLPPSISAIVFVAATGIDVGIYISEIIPYENDIDTIYRMLDGLAAIDMDKHKNPEKYTW